MPPGEKPSEGDDERRKRPTSGTGRGGPRREGGPRKEWKPREGGRDDRRPPRSGGPRREGGPRKEWKPREGGARSDGPRKEWKPREGGRDDRRGPRADGPRKEWKPREGGRDDRRGPRSDGPRREGGPRKEWKPREGGRDDRRPPRSDGPRREWKPREGGRDDRRPPRRDDRRDDRSSRDSRDADIPQTEAQRRRSEVFARKGPRKYGKDKPFGDRPDREERVVDEGSVRRRKFDSDRREPRESSRGPSRGKPRAPRRDDGPMFPTAPALQEPLAGEVRRAVGDRRYEAVSAQLSRSLVAYDAERYREALSVLAPALEDLWLIGDVRVLAGRLEYRAQRWKVAAEHLEFARAGDRGDMTNMPVLIDCYRGLKRYELVDELWAELKEASPHPMIMAEGRVSTAMAYADRNDLASAIRIMTHGTEPRQVQPHHVLEWYVLGDLHDRAGDPVSAKRFFVKVAKNDAKYFDVESRLAGLGE